MTDAELRLGCLKLAMDSIDKDTMATERLAARPRVIERALELYAFCLEGPPGETEMTRRR